MAKYICYYDSNRIIETLQKLREKYDLSFHVVDPNFPKWSVVGLSTNETTGGYYNYIL